MSVAVVALRLRAGGVTVPAFTEVLRISVEDIPQIASKMIAIRRVIGRFFIDANSSVKILIRKNASVVGSAKIMKATWILAGISLAVILSACNNDDEGRTLRVPADYSTIQAAVDDAQEGDLILIDEGVYHESVTVAQNGIVIRGVDRNEVILDGKYILADGIRVTGANRVAVENMTARNYLVNGFYWTKAVGFRGSYLTAVRNGYYGIYAFDARGGVFEHSYASGSYDAGFYIGQCIPCDAVITDSIAEFNGLGYSGTNASRNVIITRSIFRLNRVGIMPNSGDYEKYAPQRESIFVANLVYSNNNFDAPAFQQIAVATGNGIVIAGGVDDLVLRNKVWDHDVAGIAIIPNILGTSFPATGNVVRDNDVSRSGMADLALAENETSSNCFANNAFTSSMPRSIESAHSCGTSTGIGKTYFPVAEVLKRQLPPSPNNQTVKDPPRQPNMPGARSTKRRPASATPPTVDIERVELPTIPKDS